MKIILSPAKKMFVDTDNLAPVELPVYIDKTAEVLNCGLSTLFQTNFFRLFSRYCTGV